MYDESSCVFECTVHVRVCLQLFFYKQKTAYEMRISDWSSDVCSSDLHHLTPMQHGDAVREREQETHVVLDHDHGELAFELVRQSKQALHAIGAKPRGDRKRVV